MTSKMAEADKGSLTDSSISTQSCGLNQPIVTLVSISNHLRLLSQSFNAKFPFFHNLASLFFLEIVIFMINR